MTLRRSQCPSLSQHDTRQRNVLTLLKNILYFFVPLSSHMARASVMYRLSPSSSPSSWHRRARALKCLHTLTHSLTHSLTHTHVYVYAHTHTHSHTHTHVYVYVYAQTRTHIHIHIHTHTHTHTHTHMHAHTHTHVCVSHVYDMCITCLWHMYRTCSPWRMSFAMMKSTITHRSPESIK